MSPTYRVRALLTVDVFYEHIGFFIIKSNVTLPRKKTYSTASKSFSIGTAFIEEKSGRAYGPPRVELAIQHIGVGWDTLCAISTKSFAVAWSFAVCLLSALVC